MESYPVVFDERLPEVRVEDGLARAEFAARAATRAIADQHAAIHATLREARDFPEIFVGSALAHEPDSADFAVRAAVLDLAVRLSVSEQTIRNQDHDTETLQLRAPRVWYAFREGDISAPNVRVVASLLRTLEPEAWAPFEEAVLQLAHLAPARFKDRARALRERIEPEAMAERHRRAEADRTVWLDHDLDGMSGLNVFTRAVDAQRAKAHIDTIARNLAAQPGETRTLAQIRADVAIDLLAGKRGTAEAVGVSIYVTVPVMTLLDQAEEPASLEGYGPIDADTARELITAHAPSMRRILTDPITRDILAVDPGTYRIPTELRRGVQLRDRECTEPGCGRLARNCDIDHAVAWEDGGETKFSNLHVACRGHHRIKHRTAWEIEQDAKGRVTWISPTGYRREADPPPF